MGKKIYIVGPSYDEYIIDGDLKKNINVSGLSGKYQPIRLDTSNLMSDQIAIFNDESKVAQVKFSDSIYGQVELLRGAQLKKTSAKQEGMREDRNCLLIKELSVGFVLSFANFDNTAERFIFASISKFKNINELTDEEIGNILFQDDEKVTLEVNNFYGVIVLNLKYYTDEESKNIVNQIINKFTDKIDTKHISLYGSYGLGRYNQLDFGVDSNGAWGETLDKF